MKHKWLIIPGLLLVTLPSLLGAPALKVGAPAPPLKVGKWFKGQPVEKFESNSVYVVEFWATWCGPCKKSIPHLTELAKQFEGKAKIIGVSIWESEKTNHEKRLAKVGEFVNEMGAKMDYLIAADDNDGFMGKNWMEAAEEKGIPTAFIVGRDGRIAWIGYPWAGLDEKLEQTIAGTLDVKAIQAEEAKKQKEREAKAKDDALFLPVQELQSQGKIPEALAALDKLEAEHREQVTRCGMVRYRLLLGFDDAAASRQARKLLEGPLKDNHTAVYMMTRDLTEPTARTNVDWDVTVALATRAVELGKNDLNSLIALAHAYYRKGDVAKALEIAREAQQKGQADPESDKHTMAYLNGRIRQYEQAQAAARPPAGK
jgi:thiol-disulfide isomerase/thioredoxin